MRICVIAICVYIIIIIIITMCADYRTSREKCACIAYIMCTRNSHLSYFIICNYYNYYVYRDDVQNKFRYKKKSHSTTMATIIGLGSAGILYSYLLVYRGHFRGIWQMVNTA